MSHVRLLSAMLFLALTLPLVGCGARDAVAPVAPQDASEVRVVIYARDIEDAMVGVFEPGQPVRIRETKTLIGTIESVEATEATTIVETADGQAVAASTPGKTDLRLTLSGQAVVAESGNRFGNEAVYINDELQFVTPFLFFKGKIHQIEPTG